MKKAFLILILAVAGIAVVGAAGWTFYGRSWFADRQAAAEAADLRADPRTAEIYGRLEEHLRQIKDAPDDVQLYISIGNGWKSVYDQRQQDVYLDRAIEWYQKGIGVSQGKNSLILLNLANVYRLHKQPADAERVLRQAIEVNPGDPELYTTLVDVVRIDLKRDNTAVIDVYKMGLDRLVDNTPLVISLAQYLEDTGRLKDALVYYKLLATKHAGFEEKISSLERKIAETP